MCEARVACYLIQKLIFSGCSAVGSARALGARCRRFESCHSDQKRENDPCGCFLFFAWCVDSKVIAKQMQVRIPKVSQSVAKLPCHSSLRCLLRKPNLVSPLANVAFRPKKHRSNDTKPYRKSGACFLFKSLNL